MSKKAIFLLVIILLMIITAGFFAYKYYFYLGPIYNDEKIYPDRNQDEITQVNEGGYKAELKQAISSLLADPNNHQVLIDAREKILALSVPGDYRQLHLALVIAINNLEKDPVAIKEIEEIVQNNDWLK